MKEITAVPLNAEAFKKFGDVIQKTGATNFHINNGMAVRYHDLATIELAGSLAKPLISIVRGEPYSLPLELKMVERHPLGSQAFVPISGGALLVVVCEDFDGKPGKPKAFMASPEQGVNFRKNVWHGILTPIDEPAEFVVVDRGGEGTNLEEYFFPEAFKIVS